MIDWDPRNKCECNVFDFLYHNYDDFCSYVAEMGRIYSMIRARLRILWYDHVFGCSLVIFR